MPTLPKKIHFIWLGGPIPEDYLLTIHHIAALAKKSGFEINLWVDHKRNYEKTALAKEMEIPNLRVRHIDDVFKRMQADKFHQEEGRGKIYEKLIRREMIGLKNLAAASDLLRYEILRQEGGYYLDTDIHFRTKMDAVLKADQSKYGFLCGWRFPHNRILGSNDIIGVTPDHDIMKIAIQKIIKKYQLADFSETAFEVLDKELSEEKEEKKEKKSEARKKYKESVIDKKRAQQSGCDLRVMSSIPTLENIPSGSRNCYVLYQPPGKAPATLYFVTRNSSKKPVAIEQVTHGFERLMQSSLFSRFKDSQFQDIPQLTFKEARLIRDITGDNRPTIKYEPVASDSPFAESRMDLTIDYSGPNLLIEAFREHCSATNIDLSKEAANFGFKEKGANRFDVFGTTAISQHDLTWLETKSSTQVPQRLFHDDSAIDYSAPAKTESKLTPKKGKE